MTRRSLRSGRVTGATSRGQALVEFALIFPIFIVMMIGIIEFAILFNALLAVNFSARNAALSAAEAGNGVGSDCVILAAVEESVAAPASKARIDTVQIFQARANSSGVTQMVGSPTVYSRSGSTSCTFVDGIRPSLSLTAGRATATRRPADATSWAGAGSGHPSVDNVAVTVTYTHSYVDALRNFIGGGGTLTFERTSVMRMEPVL